MQIEQATKADKKAILRFYKSQHYSARFLGGDYCYLIKQEQNIVASVMVSSIQQNNEQWFLHALVVDKNHQNLGLASSLIQHCQTKHATLVCFCQPNLSHFYRKFSFIEIANEHLAPTLTEHLLSRFNQYRIKQNQLVALLYRNKSFAS